MEHQRKTATKYRLNHTKRNPEQVGLNFRGVGKRSMGRLMETIENIVVKSKTPVLPMDEACLNDAPYIHENPEEGIKLFRYGSAKNGLFVELYNDGTSGYTIIEDGKIKKSEDFSIDEGVKLFEAVRTIRETLPSF